MAERTDGCCRCSAHTNDDDTPVLWRCSQCDRRVCRACTLTIPNSRPTEYYAQTFCSTDCWEKAGRPSE